EALQRVEVDRSVGGERRHERDVDATKMRRGHRLRSYRLAVRRTILAVIAACVAVAVVAFTLLRHGANPAHARLARLSAPEATDVSKARAPQSEVAVALEPGRETVA